MPHKDNEIHPAIRERRWATRKLVATINIYNNGDLETLVQNAFALATNRKFIMTKIEQSKAEVKDMPLE